MNPDNIINSEDLILYDTQMLSDKLLNAKDPTEINQVVNAFNTALRKKNIIRTVKYSELQDLVVDQMEDRLTTHAGEFSNRDLLEYMKTLYQMTATQDIEEEKNKMPTLIQNNTTINVGEYDGLDRASQDRIRDALSAILQAQDVEIK